MGIKPVLAVIRYLGVMFAFALCGTLSTAFFTDARSSYSHASEYAPLLAVPFALLSAAFWMRRLKHFIAVPLNVVVWLLAYSTSAVAGLGASFDYSFVPMCLGGFVGGLGLTLVNTIGRRRVLTFPYLIAGGIVGSVAALPFTEWRDTFYGDFGGGHAEGRFEMLQHSFAIWQAAVGTYLYAICTWAGRLPSGNSNSGVKS
jgi:hypothetical protein